MGWGIGWERIGWGVTMDRLAACRGCAWPAQVLAPLAAQLRTSLAPLAAALHEGTIASVGIFSNARANRKRRLTICFVLESFSYCAFREVRTCRQWTTSRSEV